LIVLNIRAVLPQYVYYPPRQPLDYESRFEILGSLRNALLRKNQLVQEIQGLENSFPCGEDGFQADSNRFEVPIEPEYLNMVSSPLLFPTRAPDIMLVCD
jgi:hypothetical protein